MRKNDTENSRLFDQLYRKYAPYILRRCMQYVRSREIAEDLTHTVFMKAMGRMDTFRNDAAPYTWLYRIATNCCLNYLRDHRREVFEDESVIESMICTEDTDLEPPLRKIMIRELLSGFCTDTRRIVFLAMFERLSQEEIAEVLGVSRNTVQKKWTLFLERARRRCDIQGGPQKENV